MKIKKVVHVYMTISGKNISKQYFDSIEAAKRYIETLPISDQRITHYKKIDAIYLDGWYEVHAMPNVEYLTLPKAGIKSYKLWHYHLTESGKLVQCYHSCKSVLLSFSFWAGVSISFPFEHWLWEKVWPFYLLTEWWGL